MKEDKNKILNLIIEIVLIIIIILLLLHSCNLQREVDKNKNKKIPTGNEDVIEIKNGDTTKTKETKKDNKTTTILKPIIKSKDKEENKEEPKEIEPDTGLVVVDKYTVNWEGKSNLKIFTNSAYELTDRISPESSNTYKFTVKNKTDYNLKYTITFIETNNHSINMKYKLKKNDTYLVSNYSSYEDINVSEQEIEKGEEDTYYLDWKWISSSNDTAIGEIQAEYKLEINIEAESINE